MNPPINPSQIYKSSTTNSNTNSDPNPNLHIINSLLSTPSYYPNNTQNLETMSQCSYIIPNLMSSTDVQIPPPPIPETINYREVLKKISLKSLRYPDITKRLVILDTVTTGDDPSKNNVIEIGCYEMFEGHCTGRQFHGFLHPRFEIDEFTEQKIANNVYIDFTKDAKESDCIF